MTQRVGSVDNDLDEIVAHDDAAVTPMAFDFLRLVTRGAKVIYDFQDCVSEPRAVATGSGGDHRGNPHKAYAATIQKGVDDPVATARGSDTAMSLN